MVVEQVFGSQTRVPLLTIFHFATLIFLIANVNLSQEAALNDWFYRYGSLWSEGGVTDVNHSTSQRNAASVINRIVLQVGEKKERKNDFLVEEFWLGQNSAN